MSRVPTWTTDPPLPHDEAQRQPLRITHARAGPPPGPRCHRDSSARLLGHLVAHALPEAAAPTNPVSTVLPDVATTLARENSRLVAMACNHSATV